MAEANYFVQECPTCGRTLQVRVEYLGKRLVCQHCHGSLVAHDHAAPAHHSIDLIERANELIEMAQQRLPRPR